VSRASLRLECDKDRTLGKKTREKVKLSKIAKSNLAARVSFIRQREFLCGSCRMFRPVYAPESFLLW